MNKKITILMLLSLVFLVVFGAAYTYGLFHSDISDEVQADVADWVIKVNNTEVTNGTTQQFTINDVHFEGDSNVREGKFAPGTTGYFDLAIDAAGTEVAVKYEIIIDEESFGNDFIKLTGVTLLSGNTFQKINDSKYVGVIPLQGRVVNILRIGIEWENNDNNNEQDSLIGTQSNPDLEIPVTVNLIQYLGEELS